MTRFRDLRLRKFYLGAAGLVVLAVLLLGAFPVGWMRAMAERQLAAQFGSAVTIGALERESLFSFSPSLRVSDVRVAQAEWAGKGEMATIKLLRLRVRLLSLLGGRFDTDLLEARGVRLDLVRAADGRENWRKDKEGENRGSSGGMAVAKISDAQIRYEDRLQNRQILASIQVDPKTGLTVEGTGSIDGAPVRLHVQGGAMAAGARWPFEFTLRGAAIAMQAQGSMAGPLRTDDMTFQITARADDLKRIDRVIEAGLFGTQPVDLRADVTHANRTWTIKTLNGKVGRSALSGHLIADQTGKRTKLDGAVHFTQLDFDDLASNSGKARALATEQAQGLRLVPNTRVNIRKIDRTDGRIAVRVNRVLPGRRPSALTDIDAVLSLEDRRLTIDPLRIGLTKGAITGRAVVDQREGQPSPRVTLALDLRGSSLSALSGSGQQGIDARVDGLARLTGTGDTIRQAVGTSSGSIGIAARSGSLPTRIAALVGFDIGKGLLGDDKGRSDLRCAALRLTMRDGRGTAGPLVIDTGISQSRGSGTVDFPAERIDLAFTGAPKGKAALRIPGRVLLTGTIRQPHIEVPDSGGSVGTIVKSIGRAIAGKNGPTAVDANCPSLTAQALAK